MAFPPSPSAPPSPHLSGLRSTPLSDPDKYIYIHSRSSLLIVAYYVLFLEFLFKDSFLKWFFFCTCYDWSFCVYWFTALDLERGFLFFIFAFFFWVGRGIGFLCFLGIVKGGLTSIIDFCCMVGFSCLIASMVGFCGLICRLTVLDRRTDLLMVVPVWWKWEMWWRVFGGSWWIWLIPCSWVWFDLRDGSCLCRLLYCLGSFGRWLILCSVISAGNKLILLLMTSFNVFLAVDDFTINWFFLLEMSWHYLPFQKSFSLLCFFNWEFCGFM